MSTVRSVLAGAAAGAWLLAAPAAAAVESDSEAQAVVRDTTDRVLAVLRAEKDSLKTDPGRLYGLVQEVILFADIIHSSVFSDTLGLFEYDGFLEELYQNPP